MYIHLYLFLFARFLLKSSNQINVMSIFVSAVSLVPGIFSRPVSEK